MSSIPGSQKFKFNRKPRFSVNHLADYLSTTNPTQRVAVIQRAKFPRIVEVTAYSQVRPAFKRFLTSGAGDVEMLTELLARMEVRARLEV